MPHPSREISTHFFPAESAGVEEHWMELDGGRMRYLQAGLGPPLILLHGLLGYSFSWRFTIPALIPYATIYAPDMLGSGFSERPPGIDHTMGGEAERILRFIEQLEISSFDLLGTSHGGAVAMMAAAQCLNANTRLQLRSMVLVAPVNPFSPHGRHLAPFIGNKIVAAMFRMLIPQMRFLHPYWHARMYGDPKFIPADAFEGYLAPLRSRRAFEHGLSICRSWADDLRQLESVLAKLANIPTLLMWGGKDPAVYASSAEPLAKYFPNSRTVIFPGVGHLPYEECPEKFNEALIEFLMSATGSAGRNQSAK